MRVLKERAIEIGVGSYVTLFKAVETFILKQLDVPVMKRHKSFFNLYRRSIAKLSFEDSKFCPKVGVVLWL